MAINLSELQAQRDKIIAQMHLPASQSFGDKALTRRSLDDLQKALDLIDSEIAVVVTATTGLRRSRIVRITTDKGF
jgi:hypothetical protein